MSEYKEVGIEDVINVVKKKKGRRDTKIIQKAYDFAKEKHGDQLRKSGEPYIIHPVQVAYTLADLGMDDNTICAALLHDVLEDTSATYDDLVKEFNEEVAYMVDGVTKLRKTSICKCRGTTSRKLQKNVFSNGKRYTCYSNKTCR